uniref:Uncharacterized protein n=1 Tax=Strigamia maritima TaxID=126957 RepID=T1ITA6_STRMM
MKLQKGAQEDIAGNYFKPRRTAELLQKAKEDSCGRNLFLQKSTSAGSYLNGNGLSALGSKDSLAGLNLSSSVNGSFFSNAINSNFLNSGEKNFVQNGDSGNGSPDDMSTKKPGRLQALPGTYGYKNNKKRKGVYNTMDSL